MRLLFATIQGFESEFYGRVGADLARRGHDAFRQESRHAEVAAR